MRGQQPTLRDLDDAAIDQYRRWVEAAAGRPPSRIERRLAAFPEWARQLDRSVFGASGEPPGRQWRWPAFVLNALIFAGYLVTVFVHNK